jgi:hypothetical protein
LREYHGRIVDGEIDTWRGFVSQHSLPTSSWATGRAGTYPSSVVSTRPRRRF